VDPAIEIRGLSKRFGSFTALAPLDLDVAKGETFGYLGPNGAGKTTTLRLLLGLIRPSAGSARILGLDAQRDKVEAHRLVAYVPGDAQLWPSLTGAQTLRLLARVQGRVDESYRDELIRRFDFDPSRKVRAYSKGNRQKLSLIAALMTRAPVLLLDEPTSGLDPLMERTFRECMHEAKAAGQTVFLSSHILSEVEALCDRVGLLRAGKLVEVGTLEKLRKLSAVTVEAVTARAPRDLAGLLGVTNVRVQGARVSCQVQGSMEPLLAALAEAGVERILSREPSLEELFLEFYGPEAADASR